MRTVTLNDYKRRLLRVLVHIQGHLDESLALEELAGLACFSPFHFHRIFKGMVGESVKEHVRRLRLERAAGQLKLGPQSVLSIALDAGYESHEAFTRSFRSVFGVSPSQFRASRRRPLETAAPSGLHYRDGGNVSHFKTLQPGGKKMEVKIVHRGPARGAFMRHVGPYSDVGKTWNRFLPALGKEGLLGGDTQFIGICHDDPEVTPPERIRYDACVYDRECATIAVMKEFAASRQLEFHGRHHEIYLSDPRRVPAERLKTILRCPARRSSAECAVRSGE